jgi:hypothetical protein
MPCEQAHVDVVTTTRPVADDDVDLLALVEIGDRIGDRTVRREQRQGHHRQRRTKRPDRRHRFPSPMFFLADGTILRVANGIIQPNGARQIKQGRRQR